MNIRRHQSTSRLTLASPGAAGSLGNGKNIVIDTTVPTISYTSISPTSPGTSQTPSVTISLSEASASNGLRLYSDSGCVTPASPTVTGVLGSNSVTTSALTANTATSIYGRMTDVAGNVSACSSLITYTHDNTAPTVSAFARAAGQPAVTNSVPIQFTITFSEAINPASFTTADLSDTGTAGTTTWSITDSGDQTTFTVNASPSANGTVIPRIAASAVTDVAGNSSGASAVTASNSVSYSAASLTVTVNQAGEQVDPTNNQSIQFTVVFSAAINPATFTTADIVQNGTATGITWGLSTSDNITYTLSTSAVTGDGTVIPSIAANSVQDPATNNNAASTSTDNTVTFDSLPPTFSGTPAVSGGNPGTTLTPTITGTTSEASTVTLYFDSGCLTAKSSATANTAYATPGITTTANVTANGTTGIWGVVVDTAGNTSGCVSLLTYTHDNTAPTVSSFVKAAGQASATNALPVNFTLTFSGSIQPASLNASDISNTGTATGVTWSVTQFSGSVYTIAATASGEGTLVPRLAASSVLDVAGSANASAATSSDPVTYDTTAPVITYSSINPASPANSSTPTVTMSLSENTTVTLYSENTCGSAISSATALTSGAGKNLTTSSLTSHKTTIYAKGVDAAGNASSCSSMATYYYFSGVVFTSISAPSGSQFTLNWTAGTADGTFGPSMQYLLCGASSPYSIDTVAECETAVVRTYTTNSLTYTESGTPAYYYNIVAKNADNIKMIYKPVAADHTATELVVFDASVNGAFNGGSISHGAAVTSYSDLSPLAASGVSGDNPIYSSSCSGGKPGIVISSTQNLSFPHHASMNVSAFSFVLVFKPANTTTVWQSIWFKDSPSSWATGPGFGDAANTGHGWGAWAGSYQSSPAIWGAISTNQPTILIGTFSGGSLVLTDHNGESITQMGGAITNNVSPFYIGGYVGGGACVSELKYLSKALSAAEQSHIFRVMKSKWNISPVGSGKARIFATSTTYNGSLGGLAGADSKCQTRASAAGLPHSGYYKAFMSDSTTNAKDRFTLTGDVFNNRLSSSGAPALVGVNMSDLIDNAILHAILYDEFGNLASSVNSWTGTNINGVRDGAMCLEWTDATAGASAKIGSNSLETGAWINDNAVSGLGPVNGYSYCNNTQSILCLFDGVVPSSNSVIFVSNNTSGASLIGGLSGADSTCQSEAASAGLANSASYKALLSNKESSINARDRVTINGAVLDARPAGSGGPRTIATSAADLFDGTIAAPIEYQADGGLVSSAERVWTGTASDGNIDPSASTTCSGWAAMSISTTTRGTVGVTDSTWLKFDTASSCSTGVGRIYCVGPQ